MILYYIVTRYHQSVCVRKTTLPVSFLKTKPYIINGIATLFKTDEIIRLFLIAMLPSFEVTFILNPKESRQNAKSGPSWLKSRGIKPYLTLVIKASVGNCWRSLSKQCRKRGTFRKLRIPNFLGQQNWISGSA